MLDLDFFKNYNDRCILQPIIMAALLLARF